MKIEISNAPHALTPLAPHPQERNNLGLFIACYPNSLVVWNFYSDL